jgi:hypothetical protein
VDVYESTVNDEFFPFLHSVPVGNHTGVRWMALTDDAGDGLLFTSDNNLMEASALNFTAAEIDANTRPYMLENLFNTQSPAQRKTVVSLNHKARGIGSGIQFSTYVNIAVNATYSYTMGIRPISASSDFDALYQVLGSAETPDPITAVTVGVEQLVASCAANVPVTVAGEDLGEVIVKIASKDGLVYGEAVMTGAGKAVVRIEKDKDIPVGVYDVVVTAAGFSKTAELNVVPLPGDIWEPTVQPDDGDLLVIFAGAITPGAKGYGAAVNKTSVAFVQDDTRVLRLKNVSLKDGANEIVVSGIKYEEYFPSYSFTFTLPYNLSVAVN